jgi:hypothetical protein
MHREGVLAMAKAAEQAGAPAGIIQVIAEPDLPLIDHVMQSPRVNVILATGGTPMVRAAYSSGNPAIGVGPGNAPAFVDASADLERRRQAHHRVQELRQLDPLHQRKRGGGGGEHRRQAAAGLAKAGAYVAKPEEVDDIRELPVRPRLLQHRRAGQERGRDRRQGRASRCQRHQGASWPRSTASASTRRCPRKSSARSSASCACRMSSRHLDGARADPHVRRRPFRRDPQQHAGTILSYAGAVKALRVVVNAPCSQGRAGFGTHLAPSFTIGTATSAAPRSGRISGPSTW